MAEVYNPLYFSLVKSLYDHRAIDNKAVNNQFVANLTETGHMFQISAQGFQKITGISWADWQAQHDTTTQAPTTEAATTKASTTEAPTTKPKTSDKTITKVTSKVPNSDNVIQ